MRLRLKGLELCTRSYAYVQAQQEGGAKGGDGNYPVYGPACTCTLVKEVGEKNTPSYLVHFYPLKQFQHCFKIVLSRVIVLCMRPRSSGLRQCVRTLDSSRT